MSDNTDTLEDVLKEYNCDEFECWCADKPELIQALNLYIEEKERLARIDELEHTYTTDGRVDNLHWVKGDRTLSKKERIQELRGVEITDEDIKKGWPKL